MPGCETALLHVAAGIKRRPMSVRQGSSSRVRLQRGNKTMFNGAKRMTCVEVRDILSDLIDVRNGEIPPVGASRLSEPEVRADAESHLAGCAECRAELIVMEEVG